MTFVKPEESLEDKHFNLFFFIRSTK